MLTWAQETPVDLLASCHRRGSYSRPTTNRLTSTPSNRTSCHSVEDVCYSAAREIFWIAAGSVNAKPTLIVARMAVRSLVKYAERST